jgi:hypothetical protein
MGLETWPNLVQRPATIAEIQQLQAVVDRDLGDAEKGVSPDTQFTLAYNAALQLCTIALRAEGYEVVRRTPGHHALVINTLPLTLGEQHRETQVFLSFCSTKRHQAFYDQVGVATEKDAEELRRTAGQLREDVLAWLRRSHPELVANPRGQR